MIRRGAWLAVLWLVACGDTGDTAEESSTVTETRPAVVLETSVGDIVMELAPDAAPETVANFLLHVRGGFYNGLTFHRIKPGFMIQTGQVEPGFNKRTSNATAVANENPNGLSNTRGTVAMARTGDPHGAIAEFYLNLVNNAAGLDFRDSTIQGFGYVVFGRVTSGMDVVDSIGRIRTEAFRNYPDFPVAPPVITRAYVRDPS